MFVMKKILWTFFTCLISANIVFGSAFVDDYVDIASSFVQEGKYSQALNYINKALDIDKGNVRLINMQQDLYKLIGREDASLSSAGIDNTDNASQYLFAAINFYDSGKFPEAKDLLNKYIERMPKSDFAYMLRAKTNMNMEETPSALRDIKSAQAICDSDEYQLVEALILYKNGKYSQSCEILNKLSNNIQIYNVYKYLGLNNFKLGNYKEAVENFDRAILLYDDDKTILSTYNEAKRMSYGK